ncbi:MAG: glycosyltransferase [Vicinamibacterales bacterium]
MKVAHVITDLGIGGAAIMLRRLTLELQRIGVQNTVIALDQINRHYDDLRSGGIALHDLSMGRGVSGLRAFRRLQRLLHAVRPDVVHTWMYHADLVGGLASRLGRVAPVVWGLHHTPEPDEPLKPLTRAIVRVNAMLSTRVPTRIICCAQSAKRAHEALGFVSTKLVTITNGFDTDAFVPDPAARLSLRSELGLGPEVPLVGLMARFHPQKGHDQFVQAVPLLPERHASAHFVLAGRGVSDRNTELGGWLAASGAAARFHLLGIRHDMPRLMAACDIVSSTACFGEAFPLVLGEAMSCGVPCAATDIGDSADLVGDTGRVVPPHDPRAIAEAWTSLLDLSAGERQALGRRARDRVVANFGIARCVQEHLTLYREVAASRGAAVSSDRPADSSDRAD